MRTRMMMMMLMMMMMMIMMMMMMLLMMMMMLSAKQKLKGTQSYTIYFFRWTRPLGMPATHTSKSLFYNKFYAQTDPHPMLGPFNGEFPNDPPQKTSLSMLNQLNYLKMSFQTGNEPYSKALQNHYKPVSVLHFFRGMNTWFLAFPVTKKPSMLGCLINSASTNQVGTK